VVGGETLAAAIKATRYGGVVTCCGLVGSPELHLNVYPFILRGVTLAGIDSVQSSRAARLQVWKRLASDWKPAMLDEMATECILTGLEEKIPAMLKGGATGRTLVNLLAS
jgi:NADPH:quinone reductase-like Zn-dependent oxidoreductase